MIILYNSLVDSLVFGVHKSLQVAQQYAYNCSQNSSKSLYQVRSSSQLAMSSNPTSIHDVVPYVGITGSAEIIKPQH